MLIFRSKEVRQVTGDTFPGEALRAANTKRTLGLSPYREKVDSYKDEDEDDAKARKFNS